MTKNQIICPACGSENIARSEFENTEQLTLGPEFAFKQVNYKCNECEEEGDFAAETDKNFVVAQKSAQEGLVRNTIEELCGRNISMAFFERVFELPARTLTRWKTGDFSSSAIALLRIAKTYPWIAEVAERRFESNFSRGILIREAAIALGTVAQEIPGANFQVVVRADNAAVSAVASFSAPTQTPRIVSDTPLIAATG